MKTAVFWNVAPFSPTDSNPRFKEAHHLHDEGNKSSQSTIHIFTAMKTPNLIQSQQCQQNNLNNKAINPTTKRQKLKDTVNTNAGNWT
jgi:hypothetical protein